MLPTKYQLALTKLHNLIESGEIIPDIENEIDGVIEGHSKDGKIKFSRNPECYSITIERHDNIGATEYNIPLYYGFKVFVLTLVREFN